METILEKVSESEYKEIEVTRTETIKTVDDLIAEKQGYLDGITSNLAQVDFLGTKVAEVDAKIVKLQAIDMVIPVV